MRATLDSRDGTAGAEAASPARDPAAAGRPGPRRWPRLALKAAGWGLLGGLGLFVALVLWLALTVPLADPAETSRPQPSLALEAADGTLFATRGSYRGVRTRLQELPAHLIDAVVSIEDRRFFGHLGVDLRGVARAAVANLSAGGVREGGSTITQQLARLTYLSQEKTLRRKLQEALLAVWLEARLSKDEILERYLNEAYFGAGAHGVEGASRRYFGKPAREVTLAEAAMLAGLVQAPSLYAPTRDMEQARARAETVLRAMVDAGRLAPEAAEAAIAAPATLAVNPGADPDRGYFADWVAGEAGRLLGPVAAEFAVRTTLDPELQEAAERAVAGRLSKEGARRDAGQAALVVVALDGAVLAMVGGRDYAASQFNRATQARRQPGSLFKLFVYMAAFNAGLAPDTVVVDEPVRLGDWEPRNNGGRHAGPVTLRAAFAHSINTVAVRLMQHVGAEPVIALAKGLGIGSPLAPDPSLALGTSPVTLLEMTRAYAAVAAGRPSVEPHGIASVRGGGQTFYARPHAGPPPPEESLPWPRARMLDLLLAVVREGSGRAAALDRPAAGKTGTTQDNRDAWYVGLTADAAVGVWVGNDDNSPMDEVTGSGLPALIWRDFMREADRLKGGAAETTPPPPPAETGGSARRSRGTRARERS